MLETSQTGFLEKCDIQMNLTRLFDNIYQNRMKKGKNRKAMWLLFVDFKSAYDKVDRSILYEELKKKKILETDEIKMSKFIHQRMEVGLGKSSCQTEVGVPQGSTISPLLFNIFLDSLLKTTHSNKTSSFNQFGFADDLLFTSFYQEDIRVTIDEVENWCKNSGMQLNKKNQQL